MSDCTDKTQGPLLASDNPDIDMDRRWPALVDPFAERIVPQFPLEALPTAFQNLSIEKSAQSGFDVGAYAFGLLVAAGNTIDHRSRLDMGIFRSPAFMWGGMVGASGGGKSPLLSAIKEAPDNIERERVEQSQHDQARWEQLRKQAMQDKVEPPQEPAWRQRHVLDTTVEALGKLLVSNPEGVNYYHEEITEFIGRMDAYSGKDGGKDRGTFLRAYDGGTVTINRASSRTPLVVPHFSVGILAGIQPEVLAHKFKAPGSGADGLYQRFLPYCIKDAGVVDYDAYVGDRTRTAVLSLFQSLDGMSGPVSVAASREAKVAMQDFHNNVRTLGNRTPARRFSEHLDKYPGFLARVALTLHVIEAVENGTDPQRMLTGDTMQKAISVLGVLYRHSEALYAELDQASGTVRELAQSAAEAILSKGWSEFYRGDLTRDATHWQKSEDREGEPAIDLLIELGWIADITPPAMPGKRGRRSAGKYLVNPAVPHRFAVKAERVVEARAERFNAIQSITQVID